MARVQSVIQDCEEHTCNAHSRCLAVTSCVPSLRHKRAAEVVLRSYVTDEGQVWKLSRSIGTVIGVDRSLCGRFQRCANVNNNNSDNVMSAKYASTEISGTV